jgi:glutamate dehydrogenase
MAYYSVEKQKQIIAEVVALVRKELPEEKSTLLERFIAFYYAKVSDQDLSERSVEDLYGAAVSSWNCLSRRTSSKDQSVIVYNPDHENSGWQSKHTIIEIALPSKPFLLDSLRMTLSEKHIIYLMVSPGPVILTRDAKGKVTDFEVASHDSKGDKELSIYFEINRLTTSEELLQLKNEIEAVLTDVADTVAAWKPMMDASDESIASLTEVSRHLPETEVKEAISLLKWLADNNFTYLGVCDYRYEGKELKLLPESFLGLCKSKYQAIDAPARFHDHSLVDMQQLMVISTVHRPSRPYRIAVKYFDEHGNHVGERHFYGLFTSTAYYCHPDQIPFIRNKVNNVLKKSGYAKEDHDGRTLLNILETYPRDELFQSNEKDLFDISMGIMHLHERARVRLFIRKDYQNRYYSCLIFIPRDRFSSLLREKLSSILMEALHGVRVEFTSRFSESILASTHLIITLDPKLPAKPVDPQALENILVDASRTWGDSLYDALIEHCGEALGVDLYEKYKNAFHAGYREAYSPRTAVDDIQHMEALKTADDIGMSLYKPLEPMNGHVHFKTFMMTHAIPLSDVLPLLENMGFKVLGERASHIQLQPDQSIWINEFVLNPRDATDVDVDEMRNNFQEAFERTWRDDAENDGFNALIVCATLNWREVAMLRAYAKYFRQIGVHFSQQYIERTLTRYPALTHQLMSLFRVYFDPTVSRSSKEDKKIETAILEGIDAVTNLDEDRILRSYLSAIKATLRTNFYQTTADGQYKPYISFKVNPKEIPGMPLPYPEFEIFVYAPWVEGVHLRGAKVARGGLRWSDRREDFRTEVLGLMKAQQVKNAVIVPAGAKGGFVPKSIPSNATRDEVLQEGIRCYKTFIRALLDITDNREGDNVVPPPQVVRRDEDDPYLVVAADKGTATFSDIANGVAAEYNFWLGDAFASGGSQGYDHKKMGITAKGAWESVKQHFSELDIDMQHEPFTVVGIGDMSGDVFGNGMLLSHNIKLVAAFNHQHIFIDPTPDVEKSFAERQRLFDLPRSTWADYNAELISEGGGVFSRQVKSIHLTQQIKAVLQITADELTPNELMTAILKAPVDLLWNGGIGTYVKAESETNADVGDRANDALRINGNDLRCKCVGEGGNLGFTQLGRIEYSLAGGILFTDFIDNAGGVNCSDHEVNLKILLNKMVAEGDMTYKQRNELLVDMTDEVSRLVLADNFYQTQALSLSASRAAKTFDEYVRFMLDLERNDRLNRSLEYLPTDKEITRRRAEKIGFTRPELAVLLAYSKIDFKDMLLDSALMDDPACLPYLESAFPAQIGEGFMPQLQEHRLRREIIATQLSNAICNRMGPTFVKRIYDESGANPPQVAKSYLVASHIFDMDALWAQIQGLGTTVHATVQHDMMVILMRLIRRATRWFLRNRRVSLDIKECIDTFQPHIADLSAHLADVLAGEELEKLFENTQGYESEGVPLKLALAIASCRALVSAMDIIEAALIQSIPVKDVAIVYFSVGARLHLDWFRARIASHDVNDNWDALARAAYRDDVDRQQRSITESILYYCKQCKDATAGIAAWEEEQSELVARWRFMLNDLRASTSEDFTMYAVALRELSDLAQASHSQLQRLVH